MSIKRFENWVVVKEGIQTVPGMPYWYISKQEIINRDFTNLYRFIKFHWVNEKAVKKAYSYAFKYYQATTFYTSKSHPDIYEAMLEQYESESANWFRNESSNYLIKVPEDFYITVFRDKKKTDRWTWVYNEFFCPTSYKTLETAKKKAFASYYWLYRHVIPSIRHL